ncbi:MAG: hypothetical protein HQL08_12765 [Nitrospirae bacterium]|nr:hypothetical protein [Nitrospirota bacterium]
MTKLLFDKQHLQDWVNAAEGIEERFGIDKAMGYLIGEIFYNSVFVHTAVIQEVPDGKCCEQK